MMLHRTPTTISYCIMGTSGRHKIRQSALWGAIIWQIPSPYMNDITEYGGTFDGDNGGLLSLSPNSALSSGL